MYSYSWTWGPISMAVGGPAGDSRVGHPPSLVIKAQGRNTQSDLFACIATNAGPLDEILHAFHADPTAVPHSPAPAHTISSWSVLPVPAKFACLFLKGLLLIEGFVLGCELLHLTPDRFAE
jgi:hypothetical protein